MQEKISWSAESHLGKVLHQWWQGLEQDRASRAMLRRCATLDEVALCPAYQRFYRYLLAARAWQADAAPWQNDKLAAIAGLLAHVKTEDIQKLPASMWDSKGDKLLVSELRFRDLLKIQDTDDLFISLRRILPLLDYKVNISGLAHDVYNWGNPNPKFNIPKQWAYSYRWQPVKQSA
ncbi:MAG: type I-E CRISPR-associated protein Cse2/CasB [Burkholderiaceae bacterium]